MYYTHLKWGKNYQEIKNDKNQQIVIRREGNKKKQHQHIYSVQFIATKKVTVEVGARSSYGKKNYSEPRIKYTNDNSYK